MRNTLIPAIILASSLAAFGQSRETDQILRAARDIWPGGQTIGIVCNYAYCEEELQALRSSFEPGSTIKVIDTRSLAQVKWACGRLARIQPTYVLLLPGDPLVHDGSWSASRVIQAMNLKQIPTLGTRLAALSQGAWAVMGPATGNLLQVNPALEGYFGLMTLERMPSPPPVRKTSSQGTRATLSVIAAH